MRRQLDLFKAKNQRGIASRRTLEFPLHCMVADTLRRWSSPDWQWTHIPLGELRTKATAARLHRMGVRPGWPDFILIAPTSVRGGAHFLELKRPGAELSETQLAFSQWCEGRYPYRIADNYAAALETLQQWGAVRTGVRVSA